jgi:hypothetical protein
MWLRIPEDSGRPLWEGPLEAPSDAVLQRLQRGWPEQDEAQIPDVRELPLVKIDVPEVWSLEDLYPPGKIPPIMQSKMTEANFYLLRLNCSFLPQHDEVYIEWARFLIRLLADENGHQPTVFDVHPLDVRQPVNRNVKITFSPSVKFASIDASVGAADFGIEYTELQPLITAAVRGAEASWDYEPGRGYRLQGSKFMHAVVKSPKEITRGEAELDVVADAVKRGFRLPVVIRRKEEERDRLTAPLWSRTS